MLQTRILRQLFVVDESQEGIVRPWSAASGLAQVGDQLYVVADDEVSLGVFDLGIDEPGVLLNLLSEALPLNPQARKPVKPDFEALAYLPPFQKFAQGALLAFGSGSSERRLRAVLLAVPPHGGRPVLAKLIDLAPLLTPLRERFADLNIEGAFVTGDRFCLLQRGHRKTSVNACISYSWLGIQAWMAGLEAVPAPSSVSEFDLGGIEDVPLCFTDGAALPDGGWVFCAAAEDTSDSYLDGACKGSAVGRVDASGRLVHLETLSIPCKAEGISVRLEGQGLRLLLVSDADDPKTPALLLETHFLPSIDSRPLGLGQMA